MLPKEYFGKLVNFGINVWLGIALTFVGLSINQMLSWSNFLTGFVVSMGVGYLICDLIPPIGILFTRKMTAGIGKTLITTAITGFVYILLISFFNLFVSAGFYVFQVWPRVFPAVYLVGYIVLLIFMPLCNKIAELLTK